jgi:pilus assembly protein CpaE
VPRDGAGPGARILVVDRGGELAARLRRAAAATRAVVKACPDTGRAEALLGRGRWDVIVAGPSLMHRTGLRRLAALHGRHPWVSVVLALHERPRADLAEIVQVGACDLLPLHADDAELSRSLLRAARITRRRIGMATEGAGPGRRGRVVMVASASGGCGKTFLATNAAEFLTRAGDQPVVLVDLDLQFGEVSTALRLRRELTITDLLAAEAGGYELDDILDDYLLRHPDGFSVLPAPRLPAEADAVTPGDVTRLLDVLRGRGAWVVLDMHEGLGDVFAAALDVTDHVFVVATPDRPSLVNLGRYLRVLRQLGVADRNLSVILNKAEDGLGLDALDMAAELGRRFEAVLPYSRDVARSINTGVPLIVAKPRSGIAAQLASLLSMVLSPPVSDSRPVVAPPPVAAGPAPEDDPIGLDEPGLVAPQPVEIDLTEPRPPCRGVERRPVARCRRRGPPSRGARSGPGRPSRRAEFRVAPAMRAPPAVLFGGVRPRH